MPYFRKMIGERLYLSPILANDAENYIRWLNDDEVAVNYGQYTSLVATKDDLKWLFEPDAGAHRYSMVLHDGDVLLGSISLHDIHPLNRNAFIGIFIGEARHRNKGYGAEAIRLLLKYGFQTMNLNNIMLSVHEENHAGIACYKKVGFREAGRRRQWVYKNGKYLDVIYMDMLASEFDS